LVGKTVATSGLDKLPGLTLFKVRRIEEDDIDVSEELSETVSVDPDLILKEGDTLFFSGLLRDMYLVYQFDGLVPATTQVAKIQGKRHSRVILEVVLSPHAPFIGNRVRDSKFRQRYNAVIIGVQRFGCRITKTIPDITLKSGDTLLLEATQDFLRYHRGSSDFALVSELLRGESTTPRRLSFTMVAVVGLALIMITLSAFEIFDLLAGALWVSCIYVVIRALTWDQALSSIQVSLIIMAHSVFCVLGTNLHV
jgi:K+/H+ antiporter YhaU regulatory subunit KhtT